MPVLSVALQSRRVPGWPRGGGEQAHSSALVGLLYCPRHRPRHAACWVAGPVLHTILEEAERAVVEVEEEAHATFFPWEEMCLLEICLLRRGKTVIWWGFSSHESCTNEWV